jgi:undecaprenyl-diphosphatase
MSVWEAIILGTVQGLTEFFPVSSSGHLVIAGSILGLEVPGILFEVAVHVATLVSVLIVYRKRIAELLLGMIGRARESSWPYVLKIVVATIPAVLVGFTLKDWFEARFDDPIFAGTMILVTGSFVWSSRWARGLKKPWPYDWLPLLVAAGFATYAGTIMPFLAVVTAEALLFGIARATAPKEEHQEPTWGGALLMGIAQAMAILPGISRSGSTVITGLWRRIDPVKAAEFSFLMSIPAIAGAAVLMLPEIGDATKQIGAAPLLAGGIAAGLSGILAITVFVALLKRQNFYVFAYYCWAAAGLFLVYMR